MINIKAKTTTLADLEPDKVYFFNPNEKALNGFRAKFISYDTQNKFITIEDLKFHKRKRFHISFIQNIEDLRDE